MTIETTDAAAAGTVAFGSELEVRRMGFGAMRITGDGIWGPPPDREAARAVLRRAVDLGVNFIDTAESYGPYVSEELIATKGGLVRPGPSQWERDGRPERLREACEGSLQRLRVERIDLYQLHAVDPEVPLEESVGTLADLREEGKIAHVGLSNVDAEQLATARAIVPIASVQNRYSVADRESEPVLERCERDDIAFIPWFPLGSGGLGTEGAIARIADAHDATAFQVALAWLLARSPVMLPIPGTSSVEHLEENVAASGLRLSREEFEELSAAEN
jgi:pyridoxine 4-dehydrogenase